MVVDINIANKKIGVIEDNQGELSLTYNDYWIKNGFALSPNLGLNATHGKKSVEYFLQNLLPEGRALDDLLSFLRISKSNTIGLINAIGYDTSGAISFGNLKNIESKFIEGHLE